jgi:ribosomal protein L22
MSAEDEKPGETPEAQGKDATKKPAATKKATKAANEGVAADAKTKAAGKKAEKKPARRKKALPAETSKSAEESTSGKKAAKARGAKAGEKAKAEEVEKPDAKAAARPATAGAPARRRVVRARARYVRTSARKARMVCGHLRGKTVGEARAILAFTPREVARDWSKLLESAVANAESNHELLEDDLIVREAYADEGPTIKRFRPRAMGRATPIRKRTSHLTITLIPGAEPRTAKRHKSKD